MCAAFALTAASKGAKTARKDGQRAELRAWTGELTLLNAHHAAKRLLEKKPDAHDAENLDAAACHVHHEGCTASSRAKSCRRESVRGRRSSSVRIRARAEGGTRTLHRYILCWREGKLPRLLLPQSVEVNGAWLDERGRVLRRRLQGM